MIVALVIPLVVVLAAGLLALCVAFPPLAVVVLVVTVLAAHRGYRTTGLKERLRLNKAYKAEEARHRSGG